MANLLLPTASFFVLPFLQEAVLSCDDPSPGELDSGSDTYTPAGESGIEHELTVSGFSRILSAEKWKAFANLAVEKGKHGPYKFVMVRGAELFIGPSHREISGGAREENLHTDIAQGAPSDMVLAAGYFMVGPAMEFVVTPIPSTRYPGSETGERFKDGLDAYFGGEVIIIPLH